MCVITMTYPARCKHCQFYRVVKNKGFCQAKNEPTRQKDKACDKFKL